MLTRRNFVKLAGMSLLDLSISNCRNIPNINIDEQKNITAKNFLIPPSPDYHNIFHKPIEWESLEKGLDFSRTEIYRDDKLVDILAIVKINPNINKIRVFSEYNKSGEKSSSIKFWQKETGALAIINSNQFMSDPPFYPCALVICDGEQKGPKYNKNSRGMLLAEPRDLEGKLKKADILDFDYDNFDYKTTPYTQGVQHWPILLDREEKIKVKETNFQTNRTVVAKTKENEILFITTEGGYFTLYNFGRFLKESNERKDKGFNIHTAMNLDGGPSTNMIVKTKKLNYINEGETDIPSVIGIFPRY